jgi:hypothetical protein
VLSSGEREVVIQHGSNSYGDSIIDKTEFLFRRRGDEWILEIEELLPRRGVNHSFNIGLRNETLDYYTRYLHAITNDYLSNCTHIDGAIREYGSKQAFADRHTDSEKQIDSDWVKQEPNRYKLFKLDSDDAPVPDYQEIIGLFFKFSPHVLEFFEGRSERVKEIEEQRNRMFEIEFSG